MSAAEIGSTKADETCSSASDSAIPDECVCYGDTSSEDDTGSGGAEESRKACEMLHQLLCESQTRLYVCHLGFFYVQWFYNDGRSRSVADDRDECSCDAAQMCSDLSHEEHLQNLDAFYDAYCIAKFRQERTDEQDEIDIAAIVSAATALKDFKRQLEYQRDHKLLAVGIDEWFDNMFAHNLRRNQGDGQTFQHHYHVNRYLEHCRLGVRDPLLETIARMDVASKSVFFRALEKRSWPVIE